MSEDNNIPDLVVWFDLPVSDLERSIRFYQQVLNRALNIETYGDTRFATFAHNQGNAGCLVQSDKPIEPGNTIVVYFNVDGRIRDAVNKVREFGGRVELDIHPIGPFGYRAVINDPDGNKLVLHSQTAQ